MSRKDIFNIKNIEWKHVSINELFAFSKVDSINKNKIINFGEGATPYFTRKGNNNGIEGYYDIPPRQLGNSISIGSVANKAFYQEKPFIAGAYTMNLIPKFDNFDKKIGLFFCTLINKELSFKYSFGKGVIKSRLEKEKIWVPFKKDLIAFDFIRRTIDKSILKIKCHKQNIYNNKINLVNKIFPDDNNQNLKSEWKYFKLEDIFIISGTKTTSPNKIDSKGEYYYITTSAKNYGIADRNSFFTEEANCITVDSAAVGKAFYQNNNFVASDHVEKLIFKNKELRDNILINLFFTTILNFESWKYSFGRKRSQTALKKEVVKLPINNKGKINTTYIINYMNGIVNKYKENITDKLSNEFNKILIVTR